LLGTVTVHDNIGVALVNVPAVAVYVKVVELTTCNTVVVNGSVALNPLIPEALLTPVIVTLCPVLRECGVVVTTVAIFDALAIVYILNVVVDPFSQTELTPVMLGGNGFTVIISVVLQTPNSYVIKVEPDACPEIIPVTESIVATVVVPLCQVPPVIASDRVIVNPGHTVIGPLIGAGGGCTINWVLILHPVPTIV
jgi:hypothetical protein